jgi:predicted dehydrogenase
METAPIRLGIVGCGGLTQTVHIPCVAIHEQRECHANVEDAWQAIRIIEALNESLREGRPVALAAG